MKSRQPRFWGGTVLRGSLAAGVAAFAVFVVAGRFPGVVEHVYGRTVYPVIVAALAPVSAAFPFTLIEAVIALFLLLAIGGALRFWRTSRRAGRGRLSSLAGSLLRVAAVACFAWTLFLLVWGFNYLRPPPGALLRLSRPEKHEIASVVARIEARLDRLRAALPEDEQGVVKMPDDLAELDRDVAPLQESLFAELGLPVPVSAGRTKALLVSPLSRRWGVSGFYGPFTAEPTVILPPAPALLPFTLAHERAHLGGIASEDAANFFALLTLWRAEDPALRYSAWLALWLHLKRDPGLRHAGVGRDVDAIARHLDRYRGFERDLVWKFYDAGLEAHGVRGGTQSYARVAPLAIAHLADRGFPSDALDADQEELGAR